MMETLDGDEVRLTHSVRFRWQRPRDFVPVVRVPTCQCGTSGRAPSPKHRHQDPVPTRARSAAPIPAPGSHAPRFSVWSPAPCRPLLCPRTPHPTHTLCSSLCGGQGKRASRDIVQFVPMKDYLTRDSAGNVAVGDMCVRAPSHARTHSPSTRPPRAHVVGGCGGVCFVREGEGRSGDGLGVTGGT